MNRASDEIGQCLNPQNEKNETQMINEASLKSLGRLATSELVEELPDNVVLGYN